MRIISGTHKGRTINPPKSFDARPTTDFAKEGLFNILNNLLDFEDISVLDLFSGTGSISFEFASRACKKVVSVELDFKHYAFIKKTSIEFNLKNLRTIKSNAFVYLKRCPEKFDIVFADPPYELPEVGTIPDIVINNNILNENGWLILEHSKNIHFETHPNFFHHRNYGSVNFSFFKKEKTGNIDLAQPEDNME